MRHPRFIHVTNLATVPGATWFWPPAQVFSYDLDEFVAELELCCWLHEQDRSQNGEGP